MLCLHGPFPGPFLLSYLVLIIIFPYFFRFWAVRWINLAIASAFERTLIYRIVSYRYVMLPSAEVMQCGDWKGGLSDQRRVRIWSTVSGSAGHRWNQDHQPPGRQLRRVRSRRGSVVGGRSWRLDDRQPRCTEHT